MLEQVDLFNDDFPDAVGYTRPMFCMAGSWSSTMPSTLLFFVSNNKGEYDVIENPEIILQSIGQMGQYESTESNGTLIFSGSDFDWDTDARCCPSITWKATFRFINNEFELIEETPHVKIE